MSAPQERPPDTRVPKLVPVWPPISVIVSDRNNMDKRDLSVSWSYPVPVSLPDDVSDSTLPFLKHQVRDAGRMLDAALCDGDVLKIRLVVAPAMAPAAPI